MTALLLLLFAGAAGGAEGEEVRGERGGAPGTSTWQQRTAPVPVTPVTPEVLEARRAPRIRAGVGGAALGGFSYYQPSAGLGLSLDLGVLLSDRFGLFLHGEVGTLVVTVLGSVALVGEYALGEQWSVGVGAAFTAWLTQWIGSTQFAGLTFPLRLNYALARRAAGATQRTGLLLGWQIAPGFALIQQNPFALPGPQPVQAAITSTITAGFAWW